MRQQPRRRARRGHRDVRFEPGLRQRAPQFLADGARLAKEPFEPVQIDGQRVRFHPGHTRREPLGDLEQRRGGRGNGVGPPHEQHTGDHA